MINESTSSYSPLAFVMEASGLGALNLDLGALFLLFATICAFMIPVIVILPPFGLRRSDALLQTHSKAGLDQSKSNLKTQHLPEHGAKDGQPPKIQALYIY